MDSLYPLSFSLTRCKLQFIECESKSLSIIRDGLTYERKRAEKKVKSSLNHSVNEVISNGIYLYKMYFRRKLFYLTLSLSLSL
jgi:hypothetical protein